DLSKQFETQVLGDAELAKLTGLKAEDDLGAKLKKLKDFVKAADADAKAQKAAADQARDDLSEARKKLDLADAGQTSLRAEVDSRQAESESTKKILAEEQKK